MFSCTIFALKQITLTLKKLDDYSYRDYMSGCKWQYLGKSSQLFVTAVIFELSTHVL